VALLVFVRPLGRPGRRLAWRGFGLLGGRLGLASGLLRVAPDHLLDAHRKRAPFLDTDQGQGKEGHPWDRLSIEAGEEPIQAMRTLARFGDDDLIACNQIVRSR